jgi:hypothetical protein
MTLKMQQTGTGRLAEKGIAITDFGGAPSGAKNQGIYKRACHVALRWVVRRRQLGKTSHE